MPNTNATNFHLTTKDLIRIFSKIEISTTLFYKGDPCWIWIAGKDKDGYGLGKFQQKQHRIHRLLYQVFVEPIPRALECDHLCRVRHCVNPIHIEPVTPRENQSRSPISITTINTQKTHCIRGHLLGGDNVYPSTGDRSCVICHKMLVRRRLDRINEQQGRATYPNNKDKTHCKHGHEFTPENTGQNSAGFRFCRHCQREQIRNWMRKHRASM